MESHFNNIETTIIHHLNKAISEIKIAVAWFNNKNIFNCLISKMPTVTVTLLLSNDVNNYDNGIAFSEFIDSGGLLYLPIKERLMHNKYAIIDSKVLITGSYNFTIGAEVNNDENVLIITKKDIISAYMQNFDSLIGNAKLVNDFGCEISKYEPDIIGNKHVKSTLVTKELTNEMNYVADQLME